MDISFAEGLKISNQKMIIKEKFSMHRKKRRLVEKSEQLDEWNYGFLKLRIYDL